MENHLLELEEQAGAGTPEHAAFLDQLASSAPAPGGGSAAAYSGAMAAALVAMVARLTIGRAKYADVEGRMYELASQAERLRAFFADAVVQDDLAFQEVLTARRLPKESEAEQSVRLAAIEAATAKAAAVPLSVAENAVKVIAMAREVAENGNKNAITDAGSSALLAWSALQAAGLNVKINAAGAADREAAQGWLKALAGYILEAEGLLNPGACSAL